MAAPVAGTAITVRLNGAGKSELELALVEIAVVLDAGHSQTLHARAIDGALPRGKFLEREAIAFADLIDREETAINCGDNLGLAAHDPPCRRRRREAIEGQWLAKRANDLRRLDFLILNHVNSRLVDVGGRLRELHPVCLPRHFHSLKRRG